VLELEPALAVGGEAVATAGWRGVVGGRGERYGVAALAADAADEVESRGERPRR
jgi:hypothetical protein